MDTLKFTLANLQPLVGQQFNVKDGRGNSIKLTLDRIRQQVISGIELESFNASFSNEKGALAGDGVYIIEHEDIGECHLFISLNSPQTCEVVVSRLTTTIAPSQAP